MSAMTAQGLNTGKQVLLTARTPADNIPASEMLQVAATLIARDDAGSGNYYRINCDSSGRAKILFGAHIALRYLTPASAGGGTGLEEQITPIAYGIALNRINVYNSSGATVYVYTKNSSSALIANDPSFFPMIPVPAHQGVQIEVLYPMTTTSGLAVGVSTVDGNRYNGAGNVAQFLIECSS